MWSFLIGDPTKRRYIDDEQCHWVSMLASDVVVKKEREAEPQGMRQPDNVYLAILAFQTFVPFLSAYDMLVTYVFDSIFGTFILHLNTV